MIEEVKAKQQILLGILDEFLLVCKKLQLNYCFGGGSLIGVLRHKGFIPWDDDIDIFMPRDDYEKLWKEWKSACQNGQYQIIRSS